MLGYDRDGMENGEHLFLLLDGWHVDLTEEDEEELKQQLLQGANNSIVSHRSYLCVCLSFLRLHAYVGISGRLGKLKNMCYDFHAPYHSKNIHWLL